MNEEVFARGMAELNAAFPHQSLDRRDMAARAEVYWRQLKHLDDAQWRRALDGGISSERFFPTVAALLEHAGQPEALPPHRRLPEKREMDRERAARWVALIRELMERIPPEADEATREEIVRRFARERREEGGG